MTGQFFAKVDSIEPSENFLDTREPGRRFLAFAMGIGESQLDASLDCLAMLHLGEKAWHVHATTHAMDCCSARALIA